MAKARKRVAQKRVAKKRATKKKAARKKPQEVQTWKEGDRSGFHLRGIRFPLALDRRINRAVKRLGTDRTTLIKEVMVKYLNRLEGRARR